MTRFVSSLTSLAFLTVTIAAQAEMGQLGTAPPSAAAKKLNDSVASFLDTTRRAAEAIPAGDLAEQLTKMRAAAAAADEAFMKANTTWKAKDDRITAITTARKDAKPPERSDFPAGADGAEKYRVAADAWKKETAELESLKASIGADKALVDKLSVELNGANDKLTAAIEAKEKGDKIAVDLPQLQNQLLALKITDVVDDLVLTGVETKNNLAAIVAHLDNALLGRYTQEKLERFAGSKEFCEAATSCVNAPSGTARKLDTMFDGKTHSK